MAVLVPAIVAVPAVAADRWPAPDGWLIVPRKTGCLLFLPGRTSLGPRLYLSRRDFDSPNLILTVDTRLDDSAFGPPYILTLILDARRLEVPANQIHDWYRPMRLRAELPAEFSDLFRRSKVISVIAQVHPVSKTTLTGSTEALAEMERCNWDRENHPPAASGISR